MKTLSLACGLVLASGLLSGSLFAQQYRISTIAGTGVAGWSGDLGPALSAQLRNPIRVAVDTQGNVFLTDAGNSSIREIFTNGTINSVTGNGSSGFSGDGGSAIGAQLSSPHDIAFDAAGNLYIADTGNARVRRIGTNGNISTFAGTGSRGYSGDGGLAVNAQLGNPTGVAVDPQGNVYIADGLYPSVRKVSPSGIITTFAGTGFRVFGAYAGEGGPAAQALLGTPYSLATDSAGNLYIGDIGLSRLFKIAADGIIHTQQTNFLSQNFAIDGAGNFYYANYANHTVVKVLPTGSTLWIAGDGSVGNSGDGGPGTTAQMNQPYGVAVDGSGNVFVAEAGNAIIRKLTPVPFSIGAVANAATNQPFAAPTALFGDATIPISPGEIVTLFGTGLGPANLAVNTPQANGVFGTSVGGTSVTFAGYPAPILYASSKLVSAIVPYAVSGLTSADVVVTYQGQKSFTTTVPVGVVAPGLFTADATGTGQALAVNLKGKLNSPSNPVAVGDFLILYATGEGATSPSGVDGKPAAAPYPKPVQTVTATVNTLPAVVTYAGGAPGFVAGVMQVNIQIPSGARPGSNVLQLNIAGFSSQNVTINVQ